MRVLRLRGLNEFSQKVLLGGRVARLQGWSLRSRICSPRLLRRQSIRAVGEEQATPNCDLERAIVIGKIFHNLGPKAGFSVGLSLEVIT